jgi:membrane-associated phospholipid phosphatase
MNSTTNPKGSTLQSPDTATTPGGENRERAHRRHIVEGSLWAVGFIILLVLSVLVRSHPGPFLGDVQTTETLQSFHLWAWLSAAIAFISTLNDPIPSIIAWVVWLIGLSIFRWFRQAIFLVFGSVAADGVDGLVRLFVVRPRPAPSPHVPIHVYMPEPFTSYPSGHTEHDVVFYGFLLYLSFTKPVREWRYRWVLIPFQVFAVVAILAIGYSRIAEGSHWLTDALAGYLIGVLLLFVLIWLYRWTTNKLAERRAKKKVEQSTPVSKA